MFSFSSPAFYTTIRIVGIITLAIFFWILKDVDAIISPDLNYGVSDLYRYKSTYYQKVPLNEIFEQKDFLYQIITSIFKSVSVSFEFFIFLFICIYFFVFMKVFNKIIGEKNFFFLFFLLTILSFWLQPLLLVALRQGVAFIVLFSLLFRKYEISLFQKLIIVLIASCIHVTIIIAVPLIFFEKILINKIKAIEFLFIIMLILYFAGFFNFTTVIIHDVANFLEINLRALQTNNTEKGYKVGFSFYKFSAIFIPFLLYKFAKILKKDLNSISLRIYLYFLYVSMVGIFVSGLTYHDRVMLHAWAVSPILICYSMMIILSFIQKTFNF